MLLTRPSLVTITPQGARPPARSSAPSSVRVSHLSGRERPSPRAVACCATSVRVQHPDGVQFEARLEEAIQGELVTVVLKKPLGLVLAEQGGRIAVESVTQGGHAQAAGVQAGDVLHAVTARTRCGPGPALTDDLVLFQTAGESFKTVAAAVRSNTCSQCAVVMLLERR